MPYDFQLPAQECRVCGSDANYPASDDPTGIWINCSRCGDFLIRTGTNFTSIPRFSGPNQRALASHVIRSFAKSSPRPIITEVTFQEIEHRSLPSPAEILDNFLLYLEQDAEGRPGLGSFIRAQDPALQAEIGVIGWEEINWTTETLESLQLVDLSQQSMDPSCVASITIRGWQRIADLKAAKTSSTFAFFARRFANSELDVVFEKCLKDAVAQTGYELRTVTQRAGLIDAVVEDEIRRCRFLIADLSDDNAGAYWEAGFAEGLGKPVIYICKASSENGEKRTHFDTDHRQTVRWDIQSLGETAHKLKAVIRNTLLGDAIQDD
ncbi:MAG TPA: hypothetical protein VME45_12165 [Stellaceae bacterium]|nr:hypothetical protein [Stellaceae bacterium]